MVGVVLSFCSNSRKVEIIPEPGAGTKIFGGTSLFVNIENLIYENNTNEH